MMDNPFVGVGFHAAGGVAHGSFYVPLKRVRAWAWESAWLAQGIAAWGIMPWLVACADRHASRGGPGGRSLVRDRLGVRLRRDVGLRQSDIWPEHAVSRHVAGPGGRVGLHRVAGHARAAAAQGRADDARRRMGWPTGAAGRRDLPGRYRAVRTGGLASRTRMCCADRRRRPQIAGLGFCRGHVLRDHERRFCLRHSSGTADRRRRHWTTAPEIFQNGPVFVMVMAGGLAVNLLWCLYLGLRNGTFGDYVGRAQQPAAGLDRLADPAVATPASSGAITVGLRFPERPGMLASCSTESAAPSWAAMISRVGRFIWRL